MDMHVSEIPVQPRPYTLCLQNQPTSKTQEHAWNKNKIASKISRELKQHHIFCFWTFGHTMHENLYLPTCLVFLKCPNTQHTQSVHLILWEHLSRVLSFKQTKTSLREAECFKKLVSRCYSQADIHTGIILLFTSNKICCQNYLRVRTSDHRIRFWNRQHQVWVNQFSFANKQGTERFYTCVIGIFIFVCSTFEWKELLPRLLELILFCTSWWNWSNSLWNCTNPIVSFNFLFIFIVFWSKSWLGLNVLVYFPAGWIDIDTIVQWQLPKFCMWQINALKIEMVPAVIAKHEPFSLCVHVEFFRNSVVDLENKKKFFLFWLVLLYFAQISQMFLHTCSCFLKVCVACSLEVSTQNWDCRAQTDDCGQDFWRFFALGGGQQATNMNFHKTKLRDLIFTQTSQTFWWTCLRNQIAHLTRKCASPFHSTNQFPDTF